MSDIALLRDGAPEAEAASSCSEVHVCLTCVIASPIQVDPVKVNLAQVHIIFTSFSSM